MRSTVKDITAYMHHSGRGSRNPNPEFSRINGGGSMSTMSTCFIDLEMSSTVNGMLVFFYRDIRIGDEFEMWKWCKSQFERYRVKQSLVKYLESSSSRKELLTALLESSVIITLMLEITYIWNRFRKQLATKD